MKYVEPFNEDLNMSKTDKILKMAGKYRITKRSQIWKLLTAIKDAGKEGITSAALTDKGFSMSTFYYHGPGHAYTDRTQKKNPKTGRMANFITWTGGDVPDKPLSNDALNPRGWANSRNGLTRI